ARLVDDGAAELHPALLQLPPGSRRLRQRRRFPVAPSAVTGTVPAPGRLVPILVLCLLLASCVALRRERAAAIAEAAGFRAREFAAGLLALAGRARRTPAGGGPPRVYLEGAGRAGGGGAQPAGAPPPPDPLALRLAAADPAPAILYLARPCQYVEGTAARHC